MVNYKEIIRLSGEGYTQRQTAACLHCSRNKVSEVLEAAKNANIEGLPDETVSNEELAGILFPGKASAVGEYLEPDYPYIHKELAKPKVTLSLLWEEYRRKAEESGRKAYMPTQFGDKYRKWARITKATMRIHHKPGDAIEVDWAGEKLPLYDSVTGDVSYAYLFVAVLPCSGYAYVELCSDMKLESWLYSHVHAFTYFGGVPRLLIPDNLKTGVTKNTRYETVLNKSYQEMAEYYGIAAVPARVEHPQDKSHAEATVRFASTWILAALRNEHFFTLGEARQAVREKLEELNNRPFTGGARSGCRRSAFLEEERDFLRPLPAEPYEPAVWMPGMSVGNDYLVSDGRNKYSVPFDLIGEKVDIRLTHSTVEVFFHGSRVASHVRSEVVLIDPVVNPDHMTPEHRKYLSYNAEDFLSWAASVGSNVQKTVSYFLQSGKEPEQGFKACVSLEKMAERYGKGKLEEACGTVLRYSATPSVRLIASALKNSKPSVDSNHAGKTNRDYTNAYGITRGAAYYAHSGKDGDKR